VKQVLSFSDVSGCKFWTLSLSWLSNKCCYTMGHLVI